MVNTENISNEQKTVTARDEDHRTVRMILDALILQHMTHIAVVCFVSGWGDGIGVMDLEQIQCGLSVWEGRFAKVLEKLGEE